MGPVVNGCEGACCGKLSAMSGDPDVIQSQIERARYDLARTLDQISMRYSPKTVAARGRIAAVDKLVSPAGRAVVGTMMMLIIVRVVRRR